MLTKEQTQEFINNSRHAIDHLFDALDEYNSVLESAQQTVEEIEQSKQMLSDLFMYRDQWSPNANHYYAQYVERMKTLNERQEGAENEFEERLKNALASIGATIESMSSLAGAVLQIAKQVLSLRYSKKYNINGARKIGSQSIVEVIWEGRNHAMHWDEKAPNQQVQDMLNALSSDLGITIEIGNNNCLSILGALEWKSTDDVIKDLIALNQ